jgi:hypothetical protein
VPGGLDQREDGAQVPAADAAGGQCPFQTRVATRRVLLDRGVEDLLRQPGDATRPRLLVRQHRQHGRHQSRVAHRRHPDLVVGLRGQHAVAAGRGGENLDVFTHRELTVDTGRVAAEHGELLLQAGRHLTTVVQTLGAQRLPDLTAELRAFVHRVPERAHVQWVRSLGEAEVFPQEVELQVGQRHRHPLIISEGARRTS